MVEDHEEGGERGIGPVGDEYTIIYTEHIALPIAISINALRQRRASPSFQPRSAWLTERVIPAEPAPAPSGTSPFAVCWHADRRHPSRLLYGLFVTPTWPRFF